jgi:hypothetical protein
MSQSWMEDSQGGWGTILKLDMLFLGITEAFLELEQVS